LRETGARRKGTGKGRVREVVERVGGRRRREEGGGRGGRKEGMWLTFVYTSMERHHVLGKQ
jgi:hypothetical protein